MNAVGYEENATVRIFLGKSKFQYKSSYETCSKKISIEKD